MVRPAISFVDTALVMSLITGNDVPSAKSTRITLPSCSKSLDHLVETSKITRHLRVSVNR